MSIPFLKYTVGIIGCPPCPNVAWNLAAVAKLKALGFNTLQLNIAWGYRPADEPLNLEDVVEIPDSRREALTQPVPLRCDPGTGRTTARRAALRERIAICREAQMRSVFHFGAPFNAHAAFGDNPPNCPNDDRTQARYVELLRLFAEQFPGVDDLWLYTYDQDAWLCSEFGNCPRCAGVPLHRTVTAFVNRLAREWRILQPAGRLWWEPWELSAGQVFRAVELLDPETTGLGLHSSVAEVMATRAVDRWLETTVRLAAQAGVPVIVEHVLGSATEELGAYVHIPSPQTLLRALRDILRLPVAGIKEYYGLLPDRDDVNLQLTGLVLGDRDRSDAEILALLAAPYGAAGDQVRKYWAETDAAIGSIPFAATWFMREFDQCDPSHGMGAAFIRGQQAHTPSWESSRRGIFMKTDDAQPDAWMLEDLQLQCEIAARHAQRAVALGEALAGAVPGPLRPEWMAGVNELRELRRRVLSYACHARETNLATIMRGMRRNGVEIPDRVRAELRTVLESDQENQNRIEPCAAAIKLLGENVDSFLAVYFLPPPESTSSEPPSARTGPAAGADPWGYRNQWTVTTR